jgi:hypothetical protein
MKSTTIAVDLAKFRVRGGGVAAGRPGGSTGSPLAGAVRPVSRGAGPGDGGDGSLRNRPLLGSRSRGARAPRGAAAAACGAPLCAAQQDGRRRCEGAARGSAQRGRLSRPHQVGRPARPRLAPSPALGLAGHPHGSPQYPARPLRELGFSIPVGARQVVPHLLALVSDAESGLHDALRGALLEAAREVGELEARLREVGRSLEAIAAVSEPIARLRTVPGVGLLTATALVAFVGDVRRFPTGRRFASYLGLTPRESSSGLRRRLGAISKRGDPYLRMLLIHGARSVLLHAKKASGPRDRLRTWALDREKARGHNKAAVALANKLARIVWAVWRREQPFGQP